MVRISDRGPRLRRVTLAGDELLGLDPGLPGASVRLLLPRRSETVDAPDERPPARLELPRWTGNEFLFDDGERPAIRTLTPLRVAPAPGDPLAAELDVEIVLHGDGALARWAEQARPGHLVAVSGTGRGYTIDRSARSFLLVGDESALPAVSTLLAALPSETVVDVVIEIAVPAGRVGLPSHPGATVRWVELPGGSDPGDALVDAVTRSEIDHDTRVWAAGEAAAVQRIRRHLFTELGIPRSNAVVRGYWKSGRRGAGELS